MEKQNGCETTSQALLGVHIIGCNITNKINYENKIGCETTSQALDPDEKKMGVKRPLKPSLCGHNSM